MPIKNTKLQQPLIVTATGYVTYSSTVNYYVEERYRDWSDTIGYFKLRATGETLPVNRYTDRKTRQYLPNQTCVVKNYNAPTIRIDESGNYGNLNPVDLSSLLFKTDSNFSAAYNEAVAKFRSKRFEATFDLPLFLAEGKKTVAMIADSATLMQRIIKSATSRKQLLELWMEYRYGWRLLCYDIRDALATLVAIRSRKLNSRVHMRVNQTTVRPNYTLSWGEFSTVGRFSQLKNDLQVASEQDVSVSLMVMYREVNAIASNLEQLGVLNIAALGYELTKLSFVLDWFIPIGPALYTLTQYAGLEFVSGSISLSIERRRSATPVNFRDMSWNGWYLASGSHPPTVRVDRAYKREPLTNFPASGLPVPDVKLDIKRAIDALALLQVQNSRIKKFRV